MHEEDPSALCCHQKFKFILFSGNAFRYCDSNGVWSRTDVLSCASPEFVDLLQEVMIAIVTSIDKLYFH